MVKEKIILFDGVCNLCNGAVQFVIKHDHHHTFKFSALQSNYAKEILVNQSLALPTLNSIILIDRGKLYTKSSAALRIARDLNNGLSILYILLIIPRFIRDFIYDVIAKNRYKWFGEKAECMVPTPDLKSRFL